MQVICRLDKVFKSAAGVSPRCHQLEVVAFRIFAETAIAKDYDTVALGNKLIDTRPDFGRVGVTAAAWHEEDDRAFSVDAEVALEADANLATIA